MLEAAMKEQYIDGNEFHNQKRKVYSGKYGWALNKKNQYMAKVVYEATHQNLEYSDDRRGRGKNFATWIFREESEQQEHLFSSPLRSMIDARLEPDAAIGLHHHHNNEEIYYILEGSIRMVTIDPEGKEHSEELSAGDAHLVRSGQAHYGVAGPEGVRFITVSIGLHMDQR